MRTYLTQNTYTQQNERLPYHLLRLLRTEVRHTQAGVNQDLHQKLLNCVLRRFNPLPYGYPAVWVLKAILGSIMFDYEGI